MRPLNLNAFLDLNAFHYKGGWHVPRGVTQLGVMSARGKEVATAGGSMQPSRAELSTEQKLCLAKLLRLNVDEIDNLLRELSMLGLDFTGKSGDNVCNDVCAFLHSMTSALDTDCAELAIVKMRKAVKSIMNGVGENLLVEGFDFEDLQHDLRVSHQEIVMWWLLERSNIDRTVKRVFNIARDRLMIEEYKYDYGTLLPSKLCLNRATERLTTQFDHDPRLVHFIQGEDSVLEIVAVIANIADDTQLPDKLDSMTEIDMMCAVYAFADSRDIDKTVEWMKRKRSGNLMTQENSVNGAASHADVLAASAASAASATLASSSGSAAQDAFAAGREGESRPRTTPQRRRRQDSDPNEYGYGDQEGGSGHREGGSGRGEGGSGRGQRVPRPRRMDDEDSQHQMTEEEQLALALRQVAEMISNDEVPGSPDRMQESDEEDDEAGAGPSVPRPARRSARHRPH